VAKVPEAVPLPATENVYASNVRPSTAVGPRLVTVKVTRPSNARLRVALVFVRYVQVSPTVRLGPFTLTVVAPSAAQAIARTVASSRYPTARTGSEFSAS
jgi:hypothetical protein